MLLVLYFLIVIALPLALGSYVVYNGLPRSDRCPVCADETLRLQSGLHAVASRLSTGEMHRRWCLRCGWSGTTVARARVPVAAEPGLVSDTPVADAEVNAPDRVDLRTLCVDGDTWRVKVECWPEGDRWLARLVFVAPGGQVCADRRSIEGDSVLEVISQAFRLPEQTLAGRLRSIR